MRIQLDFSQYYTLKHCLAFLRFLPIRTKRSQRERTRELFLDARDAWRGALEDEIETETRAIFPAAAYLDVEVYNDELGGPRGRLIAVNTDAGAAADDHHAINEILADLLNDWATTANVDSTKIYFSMLPDLGQPAKMKGLSWVMRAL
ncbi:hypothetical protein Ga0074812_15226 [Parafrankia irregularis]|uniref:Uncharacterized protein n=1 Tax=Parafrankia irregularis TaxID=795642 RepID=A0A0S4R0J6_9ACTN|nr:MULTISPECIES: hypothetical protein [Parafrankia]MBE3206698.1 hypothetical protein [Parafrankia sp. CH37]CUU61001.1 hypothetical protein Ga0074812_15226 [Parafrankia irregularis]